MQKSSGAGAFPLQARVLLRGLSKDDFNGKEGIIQGEAKDGRQPVFLPDLNTTVSIKLENIKVCTKTPKQEPRKKKSFFKATSFSNNEESKPKEKSSTKKSMRRTTTYPASSSESNRQSANDERASSPMLSPKSPRKRASSPIPTPLGMVANTAKGGVGLVKNTAKGGGKLAVKGVGAAAKTAKGGAGLAVKGVGVAAITAAGGVVGVATTAAGGAGMAVRTIQSGVGLEKTKSRNVHAFANEMSIFGSELYSVDFVQKEIKRAKDTQEVDVLMVEDLIIRGNEDLNKHMLNLLSKTAMIPTDQANAESKPPKKKTSLDVTVSIHGGSDLAACDIDALGRETTSDPYVIVSILSGDKETVVGQTEHLQKTLNPTWNVNVSKIIPPATFSYKEQFTLQLTLMDFDLVGDDDCMGVVQIPLEFPENSTKVSKAPRWYTVPVDSAPKAGGKIKVGVDSKLCYGEVLPESKQQRHWRKLTFYDNITSAEDYQCYTTQKKEFQSTVRKILKRKDIKIFPIRFEAKVEISMLDIYETIALLDMIGNDDTIVQFSIHDSDYDGPMMSESMRGSHNVESGMEIKKLPKVLSKLFDSETLEWKDDSEPLVIRIKYGTKPPAQGKRRRSSLFQTCSQRLEQYAKKSSHWDEDESSSFNWAATADASFVAHGSALKV